MTCGCYVGSSYVIERRWKRHRRELDAGKHPNPKLQSAWNKYGSSAFDFAVVEESTEKAVLEREQEWLDRMDAVSSGYNIMPNAANRAGFIPDAATREKMAAKRSASRVGFKYTEESKQKMSASAKTRPPQSAETRAKRGAAIKAAWERRRNVSNPNP